MACDEKSLVCPIGESNRSLISNGRVKWHNGMAMTIIISGVAPFAGYGVPASVRWHSTHFEVSARGGDLNFCQFNEQASVMMFIQCARISKHQCQCRVLPWQCRRNKEHLRR